MFDLKGRVSIVTGGNSGIGNGIARGLASVGSDVVVTARDTGCTDSVSFTYVPGDGSCRLNAPDPVAPVAQFSFAIAGTVVTFTDLSSNSPTSLVWDFGDGAVENGNPGETRAHDYGAGASGMSLSVLLTATNSAGSGQITKTVNIP